MRVRDLLTMSTGHHDEDDREVPLQRRRERGRRQFLARAGAAQAGHASSSTTRRRPTCSRPSCRRSPGRRCSTTCGRASSSRWASPIPTWDTSTQGVSLGGYGLSVRTEDIARFGQLYLQKGQWQGKQLVPAAWVEAATSRQMSNGSRPTSDWDQGYGYQFWRSRHGFYRGDGALRPVLPRPARSTTPSSRSRAARATWRAS